MEAEIEVYCQPFGLLVVYQCDAVEPVLYDGRNLVNGVPRVLCHKRHYALVLLFYCIVPADGDTFFLCAAVVVLVLYFKECVVAVKVSANAYLLPHLTSGVVYAVHLVVGCVKIGCVITCDALVVDFLDVILAADSGEERMQLLNGGHKFCVRSVH